MPRAFWKRLGIAILFCVASATLWGDEPRTIESNIRYRIARGDLASPGEIEPAPADSRRTLRIEYGIDQLLHECLADSDHWEKDPFVFRLAHRHPASSIGCRERSSPSMHIVFHDGVDGSKEGRVHFDLYGPDKKLPHAFEVVRNRLTFGRTSEYDVYRGLVRANPNAGLPLPKPRYDLSAHAKKYLHDAFGPAAIGMAVTSGAASSLLYSVRNGSELGNGPYVDRIARNLVRNGISQSIEFGAAAFLQQDQGFSPSHDGGIGKRIRIAAYHSLFVKGRQGDELAFPRIAAALGTPWAMHSWQSPRGVAAQDPWLQASLLFGRYLVRSYWAEFRPEIMRAVYKVHH